MSLCELCRQDIDGADTAVASENGRHLAHSDCIDDLDLEMADEVQEQEKDR